MKTVGIIGGMGPKATVDFLQQVISLTPATKDQEHLKMIVAMNPQIPDRTEAILNRLDSPLPELTKSAKLLEESGVHFIVIPCVTAHVWLKEIQKSISVPIISLLDVTLKRVREEGASLKNIGILTTTGTKQSRIFDKLFNPDGYTIIYPEEKIQERFVMEGIYRIKAGNDPHQSTRHFLRASEDLMKKGAQIIIAACTEIPLSIQQADIAVPLIDVTHLLAEVTVLTALSTSR